MGSRLKDKVAVITGGSRGIGRAISSAMAAVGAYLGASMMGVGDFRTPFIVMAVTYLISTYLFLRWFRGTKGLSDPA